MNVLVLGGTTFFGKRIVEKLLERGNEVTVFTRGNTIADFKGDIRFFKGDVKFFKGDVKFFKGDVKFFKSDVKFFKSDVRFIKSDVRFIKGDRNDYDSFHSLFGKLTFDVVIDNIAFKASDVESCIRTFKDNIGHYIVCSSAVVYPDCQPYGLLYEDDADLTLLKNEPYGDGKRALEKVLWGVAEENRPFPFTIMRPTVVEGPNDPTWRTWYWVQRVIDGQYILLPDTQPSTLLRYVSSDDAADAFLLVCANHKAFYRAYNVGGEEILTLWDYVNILCKILGKESDKVVCASMKKIKECEGLADYGAAYSGTRYILDISRLRTELGYRPKNVESWLKTTVEWLLEVKDKKDSSGYDKRNYEVAAAKMLNGK